MNIYRTESDTSSTVEDVDGVERESLEIKLGKVKGLDRRTPRKNLGKNQSGLHLHLMYLCGVSRY
jgi:hypothetical protein